MTDEKRPYRMKRRAELSERTRRRITESAVALHGTLGPAQTSITAIAERAGVRRSTVYRHFPDETALLSACSAHWEAANPPPDLERWATIDDPDERLATALRELYAYYRRIERMMENLLRDEELVPFIRQGLGGFREYLAAARDILMAARRVRGATRRRTSAAIGHALAFGTWRSLAREQDLSDAAAAELMRRLVGAA